MPIFFQHQEGDLRLVLWEQQEAESFFQEQLPVHLLGELPGHPSKRLQFLAGRYLLRLLQPDFPFDRLRVLETGRPCLTDGSMEFSISHAGTMIAAVIHPALPVGIDVESISKRAGRVRRKFLNAEEEKRLLGVLNGSLDESSAITLAWSVKEAAYKALQESGVDFIRDLPIEQIGKQGDMWMAQLGGKGSGLELYSIVLGSACLSWAVNRVESRE